LFTEITEIIPENPINQNHGHVFADIIDLPNSQISYEWIYPEDVMLRNTEFENNILDSKFLFCDAGNFNLTLNVSNQNGSFVSDSIEVEVLEQSGPSQMHYANLACSNNHHNLRGNGGGGGKISNFQFSISNQIQSSKDKEKDAQMHKGIHQGGQAPAQSIESEDEKIGRLEDKSSTVISTVAEKSIFEKSIDVISNFAKNVFGLFVIQKANAEFIEKVVYFHKDHLGGTSIVTDSNGEVVSQQKYLPYGKNYIDANASNYQNNKKFTGKELDLETGLYYFGYRYYDPEIARWISIDPVQWDLSFDKNLQAKVLANPVMHNSYAYAGNNPMKYVDPDGRDFEEFVKAYGDRCTDNILNIVKSLFDLGYNFGMDTVGTATTIGEVIEQGIRDVMEEPSILLDGFKNTWNKITGSDADRGEVLADLSIAALMLAGMKKARVNNNLYPTENVLGIMSIMVESIL